MAIKNGVPVMPIDTEAGGAKIVLQMQKIGWPYDFAADAMNDQDLLDVYDYCLTEAGRQKAKACYAHAMQLFNETQKEFIHELTSDHRLEGNYKTRMAKESVEPWMVQKLGQQNSTNALQVTTKIFKIAKAFTKRIAYWSLPVPIYNRLLVAKR